MSAKNLAWGLSMSVKNEEGSRERQRYEPWVTLVLLQALFAFSAWGIGLSKGE
jgi:hypothetical protein